MEKYLYERAIIRSMEYQEAHELTLKLIVDGYNAKMICVDNDDIMKYIVVIVTENEDNKNGEKQ